MQIQDTQTKVSINIKGMNKNPGAQFSYISSQILEECPIISYIIEKDVFTRKYPKIADL